MLLAGCQSFLLQAIAVGIIIVASGTVVAVVVYGWLDAISSCIHPDLPSLFLTCPVFCDMPRRGKPAPNPFSLLEVLDIDVVETLVPRGKTLALEGNNSPAETTPELRVAIELRLLILTDAVLIDCHPHIILAHVMVPFQVLSVHLLPIE